MIRIIPTLAGVALILGCLQPELISREDTTYSRLLFTRIRIRDFWEENKRLPERLSDLPSQPNKDDAITDGWGNEIQYNSPRPGMVNLKSLGKDGMPGGEGDNADTEFNFELSALPTVLQSPSDVKSRRVGKMDLS